MISDEENHVHVTAVAALCLSMAALAGLIATLVGCVAAVLARANGAAYPTALHRAAVAFGGTLTLITVVGGAVIALWSANAP